MKQLLKIFLVGCALMSMTSYLTGDEIKTGEAIEELEQNVEFDSRPLSAQKKKLMEQSRQEEYQQNEQNIGEETTEVGGLIIPIKTHHLISLASNPFKTTAASYSPQLYHWIDCFIQDNIIKIEDGSEWIFDKTEGYIVRSWRAGDTIVISPKGSWLWGSNYNYVLTNKELGTSVNVKPFLGPIAFGPLTSWVVGIDYNLGHIYLLSGQGERTVWEVSNADIDFFKEWAVNDTVIIGENANWLWWFSSYNSIIINVNMNHYVRARQVSSSPHYKKQLREEYAPESRPE